MPDYKRDSRVVMTLDAGGTNFRFSAIRAGQPVVETVAWPSSAENLKDCLMRLTEGFKRVEKACPAPPAAISFAFPGPADYPRGIIGDLGNLPCFRGGVALGPMLQNAFGIPVFINNDGDLFAYGEAIGGLLPYVNGLLEKNGSPKRFQNLFGVTIGTGLGGGIVRNGELFLGDNSAAAEIWLMRDKSNPEINVEEGASIRAVKRVYAERAGIPLDQAPAPDEIYRIATGKELFGDRAAALEAFRRLGEVVGSVLVDALLLVDGLAVVGGGLSGAAPLFFPALMAELNGEYTGHPGKRTRRLVSKAFNLDDAAQLENFLKGDTCEIVVPDHGPLASESSSGNKTLKYDSLQRIGVGVSRLGTSEAVAIGAYVFALRKLDGK